MPAAAPRINVLAGVNGAGKSSLGGAMIRAAGADYYNPDEAARALRRRRPAMTQQEANAAAWQQGRNLLEQAMAARQDFAFETTLGASTIPRLLAQASDAGFEVRIWYAGLASPELHLARVKARVAGGGHDIPEADIRRRYRHSRINLIALLERLAALRVYDNSVAADPAGGTAPALQLVLHMERRREGQRIMNPRDLPRTPTWARSIVAAAMKLHMA